MSNYTGFSLRLAQNVNIASNKTDLVFSSTANNGYKSGMYNIATGLATVPVGGNGIYLVGGTVAFEWNGSYNVNTNIKINLIVNNHITSFYEMALRQAGENDEIKKYWLMVHSFMPIN